MENSINNGSQLSYKGTDEERVMQSKSNNIEILIYDKAV